MPQSDSTALISPNLLDERLSKMDRVLSRDLHRNVGGKTNGLRHLVLSSVVDGNYDGAIKELRLYEDLNSNLPIFKNHTERYFSHCEELIRAIDSKFKFAESKSITRTQKQDLHAMVRKHFRALSDSLRQIETIENNIKVQDLRSTIWVVKATTISVTMLLMFFSVMEARGQLLRPIVNFVEIAIHNVVRAIFL